MKKIFISLLLVSLISCELNKAYGPDYIVEPDAIIKFTASQSSIPADGYSIVTLTAQLPNNTKSTLRSLTFTTNAGSFVGSTTPTSLSGVSINFEGKVQVQLKAPITPGTAFVSVTTGDLKKTIQLEFTEPSVEAKLQLSISPQVADADGSNIVNITVQLPSQLEGTLRNIKLTTTAGTFAGLNSTIIPELRVNTSDNKTTIPLRAPNRPETAFVTAETSTYKETKLIEFKRAYPNRIVVEPIGLILKADFDQAIQIQIRLIRDIGIPSLGTEVGLKAFQSDGITEIDQYLFRSTTTSNEAGIITTNFTVGNTSYRGKVIIKAEINIPGQQTPITGIGILTISAP